MSDRVAGTGLEGTSADPLTYNVSPTPSAGGIEATETTPPAAGGETTFVTATGQGGLPYDPVLSGGTPQQQPSPDISLMASMARIEARFAGLYERQVRTEDAMAVLLSTRPSTETRQAPPTPVYFGRAGHGSISTGVEPGTGRLPDDPRTEGFESDSSAELERSQAERLAGSHVSGGPEQGWGHPTLDRATAEIGGTSGLGPQYRGETPHAEGTQAAPLSGDLIRTMTTQVTASILARMETEEFTSRLAKRLDNQDAGSEIVNEVFRSVLTPDRYRLLDRTTVVTEAMRNTSHRAIRSMQTLMKGVPMFGGPNSRPLAIIGFLTSFKAAADKALVNEGLAIEILPFFVDERVRGILRQAAPMPGMVATAQPMDYRGILKELLTSYLNEDKCEDHYRALRIATAHAWEDEEMFGRRIQELDYELGKLLGEGELRAILYAGVPNYVRISARGASTARTNFSRLMHLCKSLGDAYRVLHPECALQPKPTVKEGKGKETRTHTGVALSKSEQTPSTVLVSSGYTRGNPGQEHPEELMDQQGHLLVPATPVVDDHGAVAYIAPAGTQFHVNEGEGRRVPYVRTTGYTPVTGNPYQPMPTWAVRTETPPAVAGRTGRLGESMFRMAPGPKAFQGGNPRPGIGGSRPYGQAAARPATPGPAGCMLCGDPQHWVSSCPLIPEEARQEAAQRKASTKGYPPRQQPPGVSQAPGRNPQRGGVMVVEEEHHGAGPEPDAPTMEDEAGNA